MDDVGKIRFLISWAKQKSKFIEICVLFRCFLANYPSILSKLLYHGKLTVWIKSSTRVPLRSHGMYLGMKLWLEDEDHGILSALMLLVDWNRVVIWQNLCNNWHACVCVCECVCVSTGKFIFIFTKSSCVVEIIWLTLFMTCSIS